MHRYTGCYEWQLNIHSAMHQGLLLMTLIYHSSVSFSRSVWHKRCGMALAVRWHRCQGWNVWVKWLCLLHTLLEKGGGDEKHSLFLSSRSKEVIDFTDKTCSVAAVNESSQQVSFGFNLADTRTAAAGQDEKSASGVGESSLTKVYKGSKVALTMA